LLVNIRIAADLAVALQWRDKEQIQSATPVKVTKVSNS
jgi:hypothetical protein